MEIYISNADICISNTDNCIYRKYRYLIEIENLYFEMQIFLWFFFQVLFSTNNHSLIKVFDMLDVA